MLAFLSVITIIVFIHELGHYLVARYNGVKVEKFSIGFGKEIFGFTDKLGTRWSFSLILLGGYVKLSGYNLFSNPQIEEKIEDGCFNKKSLAAKISIVAAGPLANIILSIFLFSFSLFYNGMYKMNQDVLQIQQQILKNAGLKKGDMLVSVGGKEIKSWDDLKNDVVNSETDKIELDIINSKGKNQSIITNKDKFFFIDSSGKQITIADLSTEIFKPQKIELSLIQSFKYSVIKSYNLFKLMINSLGNLLTGKDSIDQLGSIVTIAQVSGKFYDEGVFVFINYIAILSLNLAFLNMLPIPGLDGWAITTYLLELIRKKPLKESLSRKFVICGYLFLVSITLFTIFNHLIKIAI